MLPFTVVFLVLESGGGGLGLLVLGLPVFVAVLILFTKPVSARARTAHCILPVLCVVPLFLSLALGRLPRRSWVISPSIDPALARFSDETHFAFRVRRLPACATVPMDE